MVPRLGDEDGRVWVEGHGGGGSSHVWPPRERGPPCAHPCALRKQETTEGRPHTPLPLVCDTLDSTLSEESTRSKGLASGKSTASHTAISASRCQRPGLFTASRPRPQSSCVPVCKAHPPSSRKNAPPTTTPWPAHTAGGAFWMSHFSEQRMRCVA